MLVRRPELNLDEGKLVWSKIPEFSIVYNGASIAIPYVERYLNAVMNDVRTQCCADKPELEAELATFIKQEAAHSQYHIRFNQRMLEAGIEGLQELIDELVSDLNLLRKTRSLAFNVGYCTGFETIATFGCRYFYEQCDEYFKGADPQGANLFLWHLAEEFEHRASCHNAFQAASGSYFMRIYTMLYAFRHVGGFFRRGEAMLLDHYRKNLSPEEIRTSKRRARTVFWRQMRHLATGMLKIFLPWYDPARLEVPPRMLTALEYFKTGSPIARRYDPALGCEVG